MFERPSFWETKWRLQEEITMLKLPLAVGIPDAVSDAQRRNSSLDVEAKADQLVKDHPEAETSRAVIDKTLREESADAGMQPKRRQATQNATTKEEREPPTGVAGDFPAGSTTLDGLDRRACGQI
jgi:hypothetical protein